MPLYVFLIEVWLAKNFVFKSDLYQKLSRKTLGGSAPPPLDQEGLRQPQTSDERFRAMSALISAGSTEKRIEIGATSGTINIYQERTPLGWHK